MLVGSEEEVGWNGLARGAGLARRRFGRGHGPIALGDTDWGPLISAGLNLTAGIVNVAVAATKPGAQQQQPSAYSCPQGYYFDQTVGQCVMPQQQGGGNFLSNVDPTVLAVGGLALVLLLTQRS